MAEEELIKMIKQFKQQVRDEFRNELIRDLNIMKEKHKNNTVGLSWINFLIKLIE